MAQSLGALRRDGALALDRWHVQHAIAVTLPGILSMQVIADEKKYILQTYARPDVRHCSWARGRVKARALVFAR